MVEAPFQHPELGVPTVACVFKIVVIKLCVTVLILEYIGRKCEI